MCEDHWDKQGYMGFELSGATFSVVSCGSIDGCVACYAQATGKKVIVCDQTYNSLVLINRHETSYFLPWSSTR